MMICKDLSKLNLGFRSKVNKLLAAKRDSYRTVGQAFNILETRRSATRQKELIAKGVSKIARSLHQDGLAIDLDFKVANERTKANRNKLGGIAARYNIYRGYAMWGWDKYHFQNSGTVLPTIEEIMIKYEKEFLAEVGQKNAIFTAHEGDYQLTEQEIKYLLEIGLRRSRKKTLQDVLNAIDKAKK